MRSRGIPPASENRPAAAAPPERAGLRKKRVWRWPQTRSLGCQSKGTRPKTSPHTREPRAEAGWMWCMGLARVARADLTGKEQSGCACAVLHVHCTQPFVYVCSSLAGLSGLPGGSRLRQGGFAHTAATTPSERLVGGGKERESGARETKREVQAWRLASCEDRAASERVSAA